MSFEVRLARIEDVPQIIPWTRDTFEWGDYVPDRLRGWIESPDSEVIVCTKDGVPVAVAHAVMLSETEGWLEAARVHPDHQRAGMGSAMNHHGVEWARAQGAQVVRLATEEHNDAARKQVEALGYRATSSWVYAGFDVGSMFPGETRPKLRPAPTSDVDAAWMFWSTSDLAHEGRGLLAEGWRWRKASPRDLSRAASDGEFFQSPAGWVIAQEHGEDGIRTLWVATAPDDALGLMQSLLYLTHASGLSELSVKTPNTPWMTEALTRTGSDPKEVLVYALAL